MLFIDDILGLVYTLDREGSAFRMPTLYNSGPTRPPVGEAARTLSLTASREPPAAPQGPGKYMDE